MTVKSIDELVNGSSDDDSTESESPGVTLPDVFDRIGANEERCKAFIEEQGKADELTEFARKIEDDEELWAVQEQYRRYMDIRRLVENYLQSADGDWSKANNSWAEAFWSDYNEVQERSRDMNGNLYYYKTLFPAPVEEYWEGDPVLLVERDDDDSHIYVTEEFVSEYNDFTMSAEGKTIVRPPSAEELDALEASDGDDDMDFLVTNDMTNDEVEAAVKDIDDREVLEDTLTFEKRTENRKGAKKAINDRLDELKQERIPDSSDDGGDDADDGDEFRYQCGQCEESFKEHSKIVTHDCDG